MEPFRGQNGTQMEHVPGRRRLREAGGRQAANVLFVVHASILAHSFAEGKGWGDGVNVCPPVSRRCTQCLKFG